MTKTNKQKCLEMWEWLVEHPDKDKGNYLYYLSCIGKGDEYKDCWACVEARCRWNHNPCQMTLSFCQSCPITWTKEIRNISCMNVGSPYIKWKEAATNKERKKYAQQIVDLIKTTWEE